MRMGEKLCANLPKFFEGAEVWWYGSVNGMLAGVLWDRRVYWHLSGERDTYCGVAPGVLDANRLCM